MTRNRAILLAVVATLVAACDDARPPGECQDGTYRSDSSADDTCTPWTDCVAGERVVTDGSATADRVCATCTDGFSDAANAPACTPWTECTADVELAPATPTSDRVCGALEWTTQFGTTDDDRAHAVTILTDGTIVVVGQSFFAPDAFIQAIGPWGTALWTQQVDADLSVVSAHPDGGFAVGGMTLIGGHHPGFVQLHDAAGAVRWSRHIGEQGINRVNDVLITEDGRIVAAGQTSGIPGQVDLGDFDAFVQVFDTAGQVLWTYQFGTAALDLAQAVSIDDDGSLAVVGSSTAAFPGQTQQGPGAFDVFVHVLDAGGTPRWTRQFGTPLDDYAWAASFSEGGELVVSGTLEVAQDTWSGFVQTFGPDGDLRWSHQVDHLTDYSPFPMVRDAFGNIVVASDTEDALPGHSNLGSSDGVIVVLDATGAPLGSLQFGTSGSERVRGVGIDASGGIVVTGLTNGVFDGATAFGGTDAFVKRILPPAR